MTLLQGSTLAHEILTHLKFVIREKKLQPGLGVILVGNDPASHSYVTMKKRAASQIGVRVFETTYDESVTQKEMENAVHSMNINPNIHGVLIQLPLPTHLNSDRILQMISPHKDVDCFTTENRGLLMLNRPRYVPCSPRGILKLLDNYNITLAGKNVTIIGRSKLVGNPLSQLLLHEDATVTICHSKTKNLSEQTKNADIVVIATGKEKLLTKDMVSKKAIIIDVGVNRTEDGKVVGDCDFEELKDHVHAITPVPGGIGPMTVAILMENVVKSAIVSSIVGHNE